MSRLTPRTGSRYCRSAVGRAASAVRRAFGLARLHFFFWVRRMPVAVPPVNEFRWTGTTMHLLYLDDSGSAGNPNEEYLVLGGVSVFEAQASWITRRMDELAESIDPRDPHGVEFHASEIFSRRREPWKGLTRDEARGVLRSVLGVLADAYDSARAFACVVHKASYPMYRFRFPGQVDGLNIRPP
ncbi:MAG: DUF3800 domain-containing protein, partial [Gemmatimonadetes bacterium]|nr:DUF3800 domain-containing protein [Gemmatimonadota bacterium]